MLQFDEYKVKLNNLLPQLDELEKALNLESAAREVDFLEAQSASDGFWDNPENSQRVLQKLKQLKNKLESQEKRRASWEDMMVLCEMGNEEEDESLLPELEEEYNALIQSVESAKLQTLLTGEYDASNAILAFHAGAGGTEAQDWAQMLIRMYTRWAERNGYKLTVLDMQPGDEAGIKSAAFRVEGDYAYGYLKSEKGVHRLVRISPFDAAARRHTSFTAVDVMPELPDDVEVEINMDDVRVDYFRASGAGGQHVNKTSSAVRMTHIPTGIVVQCQNERSQLQNKEMCLKYLRAKLFELEQEKQEKLKAEIGGVHQAIEWGSQIRSYVFHPYNLVKDHRTNVETGNIQAVMDGDLDIFIEGYLQQAKEQKLSKQEL